MAQDCTIILFDVGANTNEYDKETNKTFYDEAKCCVESIITRKIFTKPKDEIALFLLGTKSTDNDLNRKKGDGYENINQALAMTPMKWDILNCVQNIDPPSELITSDWLDGIVVAMDYFHELDLKKCFKKIILFTTFTTDTDHDSIDAVITGLKDMNIELIVITKNVIYETNQDSEDPYANFSQSQTKSKIQMHSEKLIKELVIKTDGVLCCLDDAVAKLIYVDKKQRRRMPWNADFSIGSKITIKISAFIYVREDKELDSWKTRYVKIVPKTAAESSGDASTNDSATGSSIEIVEVFNKIEHFHNDEYVDPETVTENLIKGYMYGGEAFPFEEEKYDNGGKGLKCIGFTPIDKIQTENLAGGGIWTVIPQKNMAVSAKKFAALLKAMEKLNVAIIARYTYRDGTAPKMMALFPAKDSLHMHEIYFKDNYVALEFPRLNSKSTKPSAEQYEFMDKFIDSMDLMSDNKGQPAELFNKLMDPGLQYAYRAIAHRAIHPNERMLKMDKEIMSLVKPPKQANVDELKELFPLKVAKITGKQAFLQNLYKIGNEDEEAEKCRPEIKQDYSDIHEVGTIKPADDFIKLLERGEPFNLLSGQVQQVIINLVVKSMIAMDEKILQALLTYRETAKERGPYKYNEWIATFKDLLKQREKNQLWQSLINEKLGLITRQESETSLVSDEEAIAFYKVEDFGTQQIQSNNNDLDDADDNMLDEM